MATTSMQSKLDMSLDELVDTGPKRDDFGGRADRRGAGGYSEYPPPPARRSRSPARGDQLRYDRHGDRIGIGFQGFQPPGGHVERVRDERVQHGGKGRGKRKIPPEDKALMNTHCNFDSTGDFVVRLYDTQVFILRNKPEAMAERSKATAGEAEPAAATVVTQVSTSEGDTTAPASAADGASTSEEKKVDGGAPAGQEAETPTSADVISPAVAATQPAGDEAAAAAGVGTDTATTQAEDKSAETTAAADDEAGKKPSDVDTGDTTQPLLSASTTVVILNTGRYRTVETRFIINEALYPLSLRVKTSDNDGGVWMVCRTGGSTDDAWKDVAFDDNMEVTLKEAVRASVVNQHLTDKIEAAKRRREYERHNQPRSDREFHHHPPAGWTTVPLHHGRLPPPPGWGVPPHMPPGYGPPPGHPAWGPPPGHGPPSHYGAPAGQHHAPPHHGAQAAAPEPRGPLPDSLFQ